MQREKGRGGLAPVRGFLMPRRCAAGAALRGSSSSASSSAPERPTLGLLPLLLSLPLSLPWVESSEGWGRADRAAATARAAAARRLRPAAAKRAGRTPVVIRCSSIEKTEDTGTQRVTKANFCLALFVRNCVLRELRGEKCSKLTFFEFFKFSGLSINKYRTSFSRGYRRVQNLHLRWANAVCKIANTTVFSSLFRCCRTPMGISSYFLPGHSFLLKSRPCPAVPC